jgi:hypothetical protein
MVKGTVKVPETISNNAEISGRKGFGNPWTTGGALHPTAPDPRTEGGTGEPLGPEPGSPTVTQGHNGRGPRAGQPPTPEPVTRQPTGSPTGPADSAGKPPTPPEVVSWLSGLEARGVKVGVTDGRLWMKPSTAYGELTPDERTVLNAHRSAIKEFLSDAGPTREPKAATAALAPEPVVYVGTRRVTERDVREALEDLGILADYQSGCISKVEAYELARRGLMHARKCGYAKRYL